MIPTSKISFPTAAIALIIVAILRATVNALLANMYAPSKAVPMLPGFEESDQNNWF